MALSVLDNEIMEAEYKIQHILLIVLEGDAKLEHENECQTYREINSRSEKQRGKSFSMI